MEFEKYVDQNISIDFIEGWYSHLDVEEEPSSSDRENAIKSIYNFLVRHSGNKAKLASSALFQGQSKFKIELPDNEVTRNFSRNFSMDSGLFGKWNEDKRALIFEPSHPLRRNAARQLGNVLLALSKFQGDYGAARKKWQDVLKYNEPAEWAEKPGVFEGFRAVYNTLLREFSLGTNIAVWGEDREKNLKEGFNRLSAFIIGTAYARHILDNGSKPEGNVVFSWGQREDGCYEITKIFSQLNKEIFVSEETRKSLTQYVLAGMRFGLEWIYVGLRIASEVAGDSYLRSLVAEGYQISTPDYVQFFNDIEKEDHWQKIEPLLEKIQRFQQHMETLEEFSKQKNDFFRVKWFAKSVLTVIFASIFLRRFNHLGVLDADFGLYTRDLPNLVSWKCGNISYPKNPDSFIGVGIELCGLPDRKASQELSQGKSFLKQLKTLTREHLRQIKTISPKDFALAEDWEDEKKVNKLRADVVDEILDSMREYLGFTPNGNEEMSQVRLGLYSLLDILDTEVTNIAWKWVEEDQRKHFANPQFFKAFFGEVARYYRPQAVAQKQQMLTVSLETKDILTSSISGYSWSSCHKGSFANTPVTLAANEVSFIVYLAGSEKVGIGKESVDSKTTRMYGHYVQHGDNDYILNIEHAYPNRDSNLNQVVLGLLRDRIDEHMGLTREDSHVLRNKFFNTHSALEAMAGNLIPGYFDYLRHTESHVITKNFWDMLREKELEYFKDYVVPTLQKHWNFPKTGPINQYTNEQVCSAFLHLFYQGYHPHVEALYLPVSLEELYVLSGRIVVDFDLGISSASILNPSSPKLFDGDYNYEEWDSHFDFDNYYEALYANEDWDYYFQEGYSEEDVWAGRDWETWFCSQTTEYEQSAW